MPSSQSTTNPGLILNMTIIKVSKAFFVVAAQPVADSRRTVYLNAGSLLHGHVEHPCHADHDHLGSNLVVLLIPARLQADDFNHPYLTDSIDQILLSIRESLKT